MTTSRLPAGWDRYVRPCPSCDRPILWALTANGKRMPLDPAVDERGNTAVQRDGTGTLRARVLSNELPAPDPFERLLVPHWATCPRPPGRPAPPPAPAELPSNVIPLDRARRRPR